MATTKTLLYTDSRLSTMTSIFLRRLLTDEEAGETSGGLLPLLVEHTEETILSARLATVVPFLGVPDDLMHAVRLESEKRVHNLWWRASLIIHTVAHRKSGLTYLGRLALGVAIVGDVLVDEDRALRDGRRVLEHAERGDVRTRE